MKYAPLMDYRENTPGILVNGNLPASVKGMRRIIWRKLTVIKRGIAIFTKEKDEEIPETALFQNPSNDPDNEWGYVWCILCGQDGKAPALERAGIRTQEVHNKMVELKMEKQNIEASKNLIVLRSEEQKEEAVKKRAQEAQQARGGVQPFFGNIETQREG